MITSLFKEFCLCFVQINPANMIGQMRKHISFHTGLRSPSGFIGCSSKINLPCLHITQWCKSTATRKFRKGRNSCREACAPRAAQAGGAPTSGDSNKGLDATSMQSDALRRHDELLPQAKLSTYHYVAFVVITIGGLLFIASLIYFFSDLSFYHAVLKSFDRLMRTIAVRQLSIILSTMAFVKYGLEPVIRGVRAITKADGQWEKSSEYYILREFYQPLEFLFLVAAGTTLIENFLPQIIEVDKGVLKTYVKSILSMTFLLVAARVVFNIKSRIVRESSWQFELKGDITRQRRLEAIDKLLSLGIAVVMGFVAVRTLGQDINSFLAIGGVATAIGLAGRDILENLFTGLIILTSNPFEVGEEVSFRTSGGLTVDGIVVDVGWYRTTVRSFEREIYTVPNSIFSRNVVLNVTRKNKEWRFYEFMSLRLEDLPRVAAVVADIRKILRQDSRIIQKLHRRVFLHKITREDLSIYISFYVEAANRDAFMAIKQDLYLAFVDCVERNGASLARNKLQLEMLPGIPVSPVPVVEVAALPQPADDIEAFAAAPVSPPSAPAPASGRNKDSGEVPDGTNDIPPENLDKPQKGGATSSTADNGSKTSSGQNNASESGNQKPKDKVSHDEIVTALQSNPKTVQKIQNLAGLRSVEPPLGKSDGAPIDQDTCS